jgi:hypothetical protein
MDLSHECCMLRGGRRESRAEPALQVMQNTKKVPRGEAATLTDSQPKHEQAVAAQPVAKSTLVYLGPKQGGARSGRCRVAGDDQRERELTGVPIKKPE